MPAKTLQDVLNDLTTEGVLYKPLPDGKVQCYSCGHRCVIGDGKQGICRVRFNSGGKLYVPRGYVGALQVDPVEKKPFFHALPGAAAMSFGMLGCDFHCGYCQNWLTSQTLRDPTAGTAPQVITAAKIRDLAKEYEAQIVTSTYNEPLITSEWAVEVFQLARAAGLATSYVSNGNGTPEVLKYLKPWVDLYKVDLKSFNDKNYRKLGGTLQVVLDTIQLLYEMDFWLEIVTLIVPGFNDSDEELTSMAQFLAKISPDIPWHVTAFHKDYKMTDPDNTPVSTLIRAAKIGEKAGLRYIYAGNLPGQVGNYENTYCPKCRNLLVERYGFYIRQNRITEEGTCPKCQTVIPGRWNFSLIAKHRANNVAA